MLCFVKSCFLYVLIIEFYHVRGGAFTGFPVSVCQQHSPQPRNAEEKPVPPTYLQKFGVSNPCCENSVSLPQHFRRYVKGVFHTLNCHAPAVFHIGFASSPEGQ